MLTLTLKNMLDVVVLILTFSMLCNFLLKARHDILNNRIEANRLLGYVNLAMH